MLTPPYLLSTSTHICSPSQSASGKTLLADELGIGKAFLELASKMMSNPMRIAESQMTLWWNYMSLWQSSLMRMMGAPAGPVTEGELVR